MQSISIYGKNDFAEGSKILGTDLKIIIGILIIMSNAAKNFDNLEISLSVLHNYFNGSINYFSDLHPAKIFDFFSNTVLSV